MRNPDESSEPSPVRDPRHQRGVADVGMATAAPLARPLALAERDQHAVALLPASHLGTHLLDDAAELVAQHPRRLERDAHPRPVAGPEMPVGAADAVRLDAHDGAVGRTLRIGHVANDERLANGFEDGGAHGIPLLWGD